ncbi:zinc finger protein RFP-like [Emys orbicularis]|uniref:zinc finger protein RFP-like n=1 Tax=Emys orbicularis TaxID=82168 RepID=UPI0031FE0120
MAAESPARCLQAEASCPICQEYFKDPVIIDCGHSFCRACISQCWEGSDIDVSCPQCGETAPQRNLTPNRQLANVLEIVQQLSLQVIEDAGWERVCGEHQQPLKLFCEEDQTPICVMCDASRAHATHTVVPIQEAAQEYKETFQAHLETLKEEKEKLKGFKVTDEGTSQQYRIQTEKERREIVSEFQQLKTFLEEEERLLLAQLEKLDEEIVKLQHDNVTQLSEEISRLSELIRELEGKCQKPASELLQDTRSTFSRCEMGKFQQPVEISPELAERRSDFSQKIFALTETLRKFKDTLPSELERKEGEPLESYTPVNVTLDPDTAHPELVLSADGKSVTWECRRQVLPDNPERFDRCPCVLGCEGFTSGRHCWEMEVEVGDEGRWAVGVARESARRKERINLNPKEGIWAVERWGHQFRALTSPMTPLGRVPSRIRVSLDCERGQVTFSDAVSEAPIFTFPPGSIPGERIRPWLLVRSSSGVRLCL